EAERLELPPDLVDLGLTRRQIHEAADLVDGERLQLQMPVGERLHSLRPVQLLPLGSEDRDALLLALHLVLELGDPLGEEDRVVFHRVDVDGRCDECADRNDVQEADHARALLAPPEWGSEASAATSSSRPRAAAAVRSTERSLAERARGLALISRSDGR